MKLFSAIFGIFFTLTFTPLAFASKTMAMNLQFYNLMPYTGNATYSDSSTFQITEGPIVERNNGKATWSTTIDSDLKIVGMQTNHINSGAGWFCSTNDNIHFIVLNPAKYTGDTIVITYTKWINNEGPVCTCQGSACDVGVSAEGVHS